MKKLLLFCLILSSFQLFSQGVTTSSMRGQISDASGETLIGVNVTAVHGPTGTFYGTASDGNGYYRIDNMKVGGPYTITFSYIGQDEVSEQNIYLQLGAPYQNNLVMGESSTLLDEIVVTGLKESVGQSSGASTQISTEQIENIPTVNRNLGDFLKLTPQSGGFGDGTTFAGTNNRYNAIYIDGAVNNDVFGLAGSGTNGGQTGISPFSIDIIDQFQVVLSPYDVTLGGFAGGGVNAVTKSGSNCLTGTAYYFTQNQDLVGKTNGNLSETRTKVADFTNKTYGLSLGGPLVKDKAFFFFNAEVQDDQTPVPFDPTEYTSVSGQASIADLDNLRDHLQSQYGYDAGTYGDTSDDLEGLKLFGKIDINLNQKNTLTLRHQYTKAEQFNRNRGFDDEINFSNNGVYFPSTTNSSALELNTRFSNSISNNLILGFTSVTDDRGSLGQDFPTVTIFDGADGEINFGTEPFSTGNILKQKIFTITDNLKVYKGKHTLTIGTHNEFYDIFNLFVRQNYGVYEFDGLDAFLADNPVAVGYDRSYSLVDDLTGDASAAAADFNAMQLGIYVQDEIQVNNRFNLSLGLRLDMPILGDDPGLAPRFNDEVLPRLLAQYPEFNDNVRAGQAPDGQLMFSPRFGFDYAMDNTRKSVIRGGVGVFTSRIPFVWPGAMYNTNGLTVNSIREGDINGDVVFVSDINNQYVEETPTSPAGDMNLFTNDFKYPQVMRGNLAWDKKFRNNFGLTIEGIYTKTLNNIAYTNINTSTTIENNFTGSGDNRPIYENVEIDEDDFNAVYVASNTSEGYTYNVSAMLTKRFNDAFRTSLSYSYTDAYALTEGTSSQNSSQWRGQVHVNGRNNAAYGRSDYAIGHRVVGTADYRINWGKGGTATILSLFYNGQSGSPFSYVIGGDRDARNLNNQRGSTSRWRSLVYVPSDAADINLIDYTIENDDGTETIVSAATQYANLDAVINSDPALSSRRGQYVDKNSGVSPWSNIFDLSIKQDIGASLGGRLHRFQLSFDVLNIGNMINNKWGTRYNIPGDFNNYELLSFESFDDNGTTPLYTYRDEDQGNDRFNVSDLGSRWTGRLGLRYIFGEANDCSAPIEMMAAAPLVDDALSAEEEAKLRMEEEAKMKAEAEMAAKRAEEEARIAGEMAAKKTEEARLKAEMEAEKAAEEAKIAAEMAAKKAAEEAAKNKVITTTTTTSGDYSGSVTSRPYYNSATVFSDASSNVSFAAGSCDIDAASYAYLDNIVTYLNTNPGAKINIESHTDASGTSTANQTLSDCRANAIKNYLVSNGIAASRLNAAGYGESMGYGRKINFKLMSNSKF